MGYKIGVPSMKLNNGTKKSKHCGNFGAVTREGLEEREGLDKDINHELSHLNVYSGFRSAAELMAYSEQHIKAMKDASGRKIRADAVVMCTTIFKPPAVYMNKLSREEQIRFFGDCREFFAGIIDKNNIKAEATHFDEQGPHHHIFWEPMTADGRLCAKELHNIKFFAQINENLPAFLRERGWDIENADCYDKAQREEAELEKQEEERYQKRMKQGRPSAAYKLEAEQEKQRLLQENDILQDKLDTAQLQVKEAEKEALFYHQMASESHQRAFELESKVNTLTTELNAKIEALEAVERLTPIKSEEEYRAIGAAAVAEIYEVEDLVLDFGNQIEEAEEQFGGPGGLKEIAWKYKNEFMPKVMELLTNIQEKISHMAIFEAIKRVKEKLSDGLRERLASAKRRSDEMKPRTDPGSEDLREQVLSDLEGEKK